MPAWTINEDTIVPKTVKSQTKKNENFEELSIGEENQPKTTMLSTAFSPESFENPLANVTLLKRFGTVNTEK